MRLTARPGAGQYPKHLQLHLSSDGVIRFARRHLGAAVGGSRRGAAETVRLMTFVQTSLMAAQSKAHCSEPGTAEVVSLVWVPYPFFSLVYVHKPRAAGGW
jgi:hypothetical protein